MRVIKMQSWEIPFGRMIDKLRQLELGLITQANFVRGANLALSFVSPMVIALLVFLPYAASNDEPLTATKVWTVMAFFQSIKASVTIFFPIGVQQAAETIVVCERLTKFLLLPESEAGSISSKGDGGSKVRGREAPSKSTEAISLADVDCSWDQQRMVLQGLSFTIARSELIAVVGPVGCGKSTLLMTLLREISCARGVVSVDGKMVCAAPSLPYLYPSPSTSLFIPSPPFPSLPCPTAIA